MSLAGEIKRPADFVVSFLDRKEDERLLPPVRLHIDQLAVHLVGIGREVFVHPGQHGVSIHGISRHSRQHQDHQKRYDFIHDILPSDVQGLS